MFLGSFVSIVAYVGVFCAWKCSNPLCKTLSANFSFVATVLTSVFKQKKNIFSTSALVEKCCVILLLFSIFLQLNINML